MTSANTSLGQVKRKPIIVVLSDGVDREIKFTLNAMAELEEKYGSVEAAFKELEKGSIRSIRFFLWSAIIQRPNESLTEKQIGELIDISAIGTLMNAIERATKEDMPEESELVVDTEISPN